MVVCCLIGEWRAVVCLGGGQRVESGCLESEEWLFVWRVEGECRLCGNHRGSVCLETGGGLIIWRAERECRLTGRYVKDEQRLARRALGRALSQAN